MSQGLRIASSFTESLVRLAAHEQSAAKLAAFDLQAQGAAPGDRLHRLDKAKDKNFWSVRVSGDLRLIVHRSEGSLLLCYVGHHDDAYRWAEQRKIERHPTTGAAQLVEIRETVREVVREVVVPRYVEKEVEEEKVASAEREAKPLFREMPRSELLAYGVPEEWLDEVAEATETSLLEIADHLPAEAAEALLELATGGSPAIPIQAPPEADPFAHPDAQRRFRVMANVEELERALEAPWEKWTVFLHPAQRQLVERDFAGPARVAGSAGTGKTVVALHRAVHLARSGREARVLLATFSEPLANLLQVKLARLVAHEPRLVERLEVHAIEEIGRRLYAAQFGAPRLASEGDVRDLLASEAAKRGELRFRIAFLLAEWSDVVDAWQLATWEEYRDVARLGRRSRLAEKQRAALWEIFRGVRQELDRHGLMTMPGVFARVTAKLADMRHPPFDFAVVDEAQDLAVPELRFLAALGGNRPNALFFAGDLGQRIFQTPFSWRALGVDVRGRSHTLRVNYRTSHQIRREADRLLPPRVADVDGNVDERRGTVSAFNGPPPEVGLFEDVDAERVAVADWLRVRIEEGYVPHEIGVFVRSEAELPRAAAAVEAASLRAVELDRQRGRAAAGVAGAVAVGTMHLAKGLEYRAVAVMACDEEILPLQARIEGVTEPSDLEEVYETERHLLYVACTRAREQLLVSGVSPGSEFLADLHAAGGKVA